MPPVELLLMLLLLATVVVVARLEDLFAAAMLTGIASLLAAGLFVLMDAVDVAFTEAAVGAGHRDRSDARRSLSLDLTA